MFQYDYMQTAFFTSTLIALVAGLVGVFVVARQLSFLAHTLSEIGFAGAAFGLLFGIPPVLGMLLSTGLSAITIGQLSIKENRSDSLISSVSAIAIGLGIAFLALSQKNASAATSILFGSIFSISKDDILNTIILSIIVILIIFLIFKPLKHFAFDYTSAKYSLKNISFFETIFLLLMSMTVAVSAQIVGSLLIFILMTLPAASSFNFAKNMKMMFLLSISFAVLGVWCALTFSYWTNLPVSFYIAIIESGIYFSSLLYKKH